MANNNNNGNTKKVNRKNMVIITMAVVIAILLLGIIMAVISMNSITRADELYSEDGVKLCDYSVEPLNDGTGRAILHVETYNDTDFRVLACEISCDPEFNSSEVFTFGALAQDGETSYTNEVIQFGPDDVLYIRAKGDNGVYTPVYTITAQPKVVEVEVYKEVEVEVPAEKPAQTAVPATNVNSNNSSNKTNNSVSANNETNRNETNTNISNETITNREVVNVVVREEEETVKKSDAVITVAYRTVNGETLAPTESINGKIGENFSVEQKSFDGYNFVTVNGRTSGNFEYNQETVTLIYEKIVEQAPVVDNEVVFGVVDVQYVGDDGVVLATRKIEASVGTEYTVEIKTFEGYDFVSANAELNGAVVAGNTTIVLSYAKHVETETHTCNFEETHYDEPTCENDGYRLYVCSCGAEKREIIPATGHDMQMYDVTEQAIEYHCSHCGKVEMVYSDATASVSGNDAEVANNLEAVVAEAQDAAQDAAQDVAQDATKNAELAQETVIINNPFATM